MPQPPRGAGAELRTVPAKLADLSAKPRVHDAATDTIDNKECTYGNSYIQTVTWEPDGSGFRPRAEGFITYSQSTDPASPHFVDFTHEYSAKRWHRFPFEQDEVLAATIQTLFLQE